MKAQKIETDYKVRDMVEFIDELRHKQSPVYFPKPGTIGEVIQVVTGGGRIRWPNGSTKLSGPWWVEWGMVRKAK